LCILIGDVVFNILVIVLLYVNKKRARMGFFVKNLTFAGNFFFLVFSCSLVILFFNGTIGRIRVIT
jgi:hypothetical protein